MKRFAAIKTAAAACAMAALLGGHPLSAAAQTVTTTYDDIYTFTSPYQVTNINIFTEDAAGDESVAYGFGDQGTTAGANTLTTVSSDFLSEPTVRTFIFGVAQGLPGDASSSQQHLVLFTNDGFAQRAQNIAFGTLFPNTDEDQLIAFLQGSEDGPGTFGFANGDAEYGPNGDLGFAPGDTFTELTFSDGKIGGMGVSSETPVVSISAAPEPAAWALMVAGVGLVGLSFRTAKRRQGVARAA